MALPEKPNGKRILSLGRDIKDDVGWYLNWEGGSGWGIHVTPWLICVNIWQNPLQYCKVISLQLIKINEKKNNGYIMKDKDMIILEKGSE